MHSSCAQFISNWLCREHHQRAHSVVLLTSLYFSSKRLQHASKTTCNTTEALRDPLYTTFVLCRNFRHEQIYRGCQEVPTWALKETLSGASWKDFPCVSSAQLAKLLSRFCTAV